MASLSDDELQRIMEMSIREFSKPTTPRVFNGNHCTCGGIVDLETGICLRCQHQHTLDLSAGKRNAQPKPQISEAERLSQFASFCGQPCPSCHHGKMNEVGNCDFCEYRAQDFYGPY